MAILTPLQIAHYAFNAGFRGQGLITMVAIALAESGGNTLATNSVGNSAGTDRGLYQINSFYHSEVSNTQAFDPALASAAVYRITGGGTKFTEWSTFTNGRYRNYMTVAQTAVNQLGTSGGTTSTAPTIKPWYTFPRIDNLGGVEPFGGFPKPDSNIQIPAGYPVTALLPGTVTGIDKTSDWGASVTIRLDQPQNTLATHTAYLHLRSDIQVVTGQHVVAGQLVAYNGGSQAAGSQKVPLGFAFYNGDMYGYGAAWALMTKANLQGPLNPVPLLNQAAAGNVPTGGGGVSGVPVTYTGGTPTYASVLQQVHQTLINTPGFYGIALALDEAEQFPGYIDLTQPTSIGVGPIQVGTPDVAGTIRSLAATISDNFLPFAIRSGLVLLGSALLVALFIRPIASVSQMMIPALIGGGE